MKKLLIIPMVLSLIIFSLYHENIDDMDTSTKGKVAQETLIEEGILEVYNNSKNELNTGVEENETVEEVFSVKIIGDLNTTKETVIKLKAEVKNAKNLERCNYFWYDGTTLIDMGITLDKAFDKGEHNIMLIVRDIDGNETNDSVLLGAYNYLSITKLNYDAYYGHLLYKERSITNHKGQHILYDNGTYSKELMTYDNDDHLVERVKEYYRYPEENRKTVFTYDDKGNRLVAQTFNSLGVSINYMLNVYDSNSSLVDIKFGTNEDDINKDEALYVETAYEEISYELPIYYEAKVPDDIVRTNENGQIIYEERYYGDSKVVNKMTYNEQNKLVKTLRSSNSSYDSSSTIMEYDGKGNAINTEKKYEVKGHSSCHYSSASTYTDAGQVKSKISTLLGGECPYIDEIKRVYSYDAEGNVMKVKSSTESGDSLDAHTTLEVTKEYINELDI